MLHGITLYILPGIPVLARTRVVPWILERILIKVHVRAAAFCRRSIGRRLQLCVLFWAAVVSRLVVTSFSRSGLFVGLSPFVGRDAGEDEEGEVDESGLMLAIYHSSSNRRQFIRSSRKLYTHNIKAKNTLAAISIFPKV